MEEEQPTIMPEALEEPSQRKKKKKHTEAFALTEL